MGECLVRPFGVPEWRGISVGEGFTGATLYDLKVRPGLLPPLPLVNVSFVDLGVGSVFWTTLCAAVALSGDRIRDLELWRGFLASCRLCR